MKGGRHANVIAVPRALVLAGARPAASSMARIANFDGKFLHEATQ